MHPKISASIFKRLIIGSALPFKQLFAKWTFSWETGGTAVGASINV